MQVRSNSYQLGERRDNGVIVRISLKLLHRGQDDRGADLQITLTLLDGVPARSWLGNRHFGVVADLEDSRVPCDRVPDDTLWNCKCGAAETIVNDFSKGRLSRALLGDVSVRQIVIAPPHHVGFANVRTDSEICVLFHPIEHLTSGFF